MSDLIENSHLKTLIDEGLTGDKGPFLCVSIQRPDIAGHINKWDILKKNATQRVQTYLDEQIADPEADEVSEISKRFDKAVSSIDPQSSHCGGWLIVVGPDASDVFELRDTPQSRIVWSNTPYLLPVLTDRIQRTRGWVLAIGQQRADLHRWDGSNLHDESHQLDFRDYDDMRETREPDANVNLHTSGALRPNANGGSGGSDATFHAAGAAADDYDEVQMKDYLTEVAKAVEPLIAGSGNPLILAGDPKTVGWMKEKIELHELHDDHIDLAGDALDTDRLTEDAAKVFEEIRSAKSEYDDLGRGAPQTATGLDEVEKAAKDGKVRTLYLSAESDGFQDSEDDERVSFYDLEDDTLPQTINRIVMRTVQQGGEVKIPPLAHALSDTRALARLRY